LLKSKVKKTYKYISSHDLNGDGKVDVKDRLIWLNNNRGNLPKVLVSKENEDLVEVMDVDGDGDVEDWELEGFYSNYDLNQDGVLDSKEIEAATE
jgi:Ca2+-binding EF-hand superfamily protein